MALVASAAQPRKLRVGVFADSPLQPRWVVEAFAKVAACEFAEVALIATGPENPGRPRPAWWRRLYGALDRTAFGVAGDREEGIELTRYVPHARAVRGSLDPAWLAGLDLDVAFALGEFDDARLDGVAREGVWRFCFAQDETLSGSGLAARLAAGATPRLAYQSWARNYALSVARNREHLLAKTAEFAVRALRELDRSGRRWLEQCPPANGFLNDVADENLGPILRRVARHGVDRALHTEQWSLAFRFGAGESFGGDLAGYTRLVPPKPGDWWADPFALEKNGRYYIFFEELPHGAGKAHIAMTEVRPDGGWSAPVRVLERDYHLSYPFLLEHEGALYMIPETLRNGTVELYRCVDFPLRWKLERALLEDVRLVDATLHRDAERWWMFANSSTGRMFNDELHLFHAEHLLGEWRAHPRNPVKSDARCARPAGKLYWRNGALHRPAQICVPRYGAGLSLNRVLQLTPQAYAERQVERVLPDAGHGLLGLHTLNRAGALTVVDLLSRRSRFA
jgi:hypothetical protein